LRGIRKKKSQKKSLTLNLILGIDKKEQERKRGPKIETRIAIYEEMRKRINKMENKHK
jgi:hypothetical protein